MFSDTSRFDADLSSWDIGSATLLNLMFFDSVYSQDLCAWGGKFNPMLDSRGVPNMFLNSNCPAEDTEGPTPD
eukprot:2608956-Ditylum_brightwellii.AAC.1